MRDLYERARDEVEERLEDASLLEYGWDRGRATVDRVRESRKLQAGIGAAGLYWYDGLFMERYGFVDRSETHSFVIGFSDGYADGDSIGVDAAAESHYYAKGKIAGTAVRTGQDGLFDILDAGLV